VHVHGLGVNPANGSLMIATHTGLWQVRRGERSPSPVTDLAQDTMGFTVVGPDHFLGSGHPGRLDQPPLLGLIESTDGALSWKSVSLSGKADFHVLRSSGNRVYGFDAAHGRLLVSSDGGSTWARRRSPFLLDLAIDPTQAGHVIGAAEVGLFDSRDAGKTWRLLSRGAGLLAWPALHKLYAVDGGGKIYVSANGGRRWREVGNAGGRPAAFLATGSSELFVALHSGVIRRSGNGGATWTIYAIPRRS
jgi:photosystem II stability/assembly factor-like uncharacterized protein